MSQRPYSSASITRLRVSLFMRQRALNLLITLAFLIVAVGFSITSNSARLWTAMEYGKRMMKSSEKYINSAHDIIVLYVVRMVIIFLSLPLILIVAFAVFLLIRGMALIGWISERPEIDNTDLFKEVKEWVLASCASFQPG